MIIVLSIFFVLVLTMSGFGQESISKAKIVIKLAAGSFFFFVQRIIFVGANVQRIKEWNLKQGFGFLVEKSPYEKKMSDNTSGYKGFFLSTKAIFNKYELATFNLENNLGLRII